MATQVIHGREPLFGPWSASSAKTRFSQTFVTPSASAMFAGLTERELSEILSFSRTRSFDNNELLFSQGQAARSLMVLQSGSVKHTQLSSNGDEVLLRMSGPGEAVNLHLGADTCNHTCSARAMEECKAWVWDGNSLQELLNRYVRLRVNMSHLLASRLQELEERFREISTEKVARRLALVLLRLTKQIGKNCREGSQVCLSREELAQMTGTTLFTISRVLSSWAELGLVIPKREAVVICDAARLETVSEDLS